MTPNHYGEAFSRVLYEAFAYIFSFEFIPGCRNPAQFFRHFDVGLFVMPANIKISFHLLTLMRKPFLQYVVMGKK